MEAGEEAESGIIVWMVNHDTEIGAVIMIVPIAYAGDVDADFYLKRLIRYLISHEEYDLYKRNIDAWTRWYYSMEVE